MSYTQTEYIIMQGNADNEYFSILVDEIIFNKI